MIYKQIYFGKKQEKLVVDVTQNSNGQTLVFDSQDWEIPASASCNIFINKPDGHLIYNSGTINGNEMTFGMTTQMTAVPGVAECQVQIVSSDEKVLNSFVFLMAIEETIIDGTAIESSDEFTVLQGLITMAQTSIDNADRATEIALNAAAQAREPVQVGARNLIVNTLNPSSSARPKLLTATNSVIAGLTVTYSDGGMDLNGTGIYYLATRSTSNLYCVEAGEFYYLSFDYFGSGSFNAVESTYASSWTNNKETLTATTDVQHFRKMYQIPSNATGFCAHFELTSNASIRIENLQLEKGTVPSEYRPATEDITTPLLAAANQLQDFVIVETFSATTTANWIVINDSRHAGYALIACYRIVNDSLAYISGISRRSTGGYTLIFEDISTATAVSLYCIWIKKPS